VADVANALSPEAEDAVRRIVTPLIPDPSEGYQGEISDSGWTKLPSGLIIQWGKSIIRSRYTNNDYPIWYEDDIFTQYFPIPFPNVCFSVVLATQTVELTIDRRSDYDFQIHDYTKNKFSYNIQGFSEKSENPLRLHFIAIGY
jgi:hypothetical protein